MFDLNIRFRFKHIMSLSYLDSYQVSLSKDKQNSPHKELLNMASLFINKLDKDNVLVHEMWLRI